MASKKMNPKNNPWFPLYTAAWLGSDTVDNMTMTERGIYITLMTMCWQYGSIPWDKSKLAKKLRIDQRVCGRFIEKYSNLTQALHEDSTEVTLPKVQEFSETLRKNGGAPDTEEKRGDKKERREEKNAPVPSVSVPRTTISTPVPAKRGFDPLTYSEPVTATKGEASEYPSEDVHRALLYHFKYHPSEFWTERVTSATTLARHMNTMYEQMVRDAGEDWTPPEAKQPKTRMAGELSCKRCRGRGKVGVLQSDCLTRVTTDCDACEKHQQVAKGGEWVDVKPNA